MNGLFAFACLICTLALGLTPAPAAPAHQRPLSCYQIGFTIDGTTVFQTRPQWKALLLENRLNEPNTVTVPQGSLTLGALGQGLISDLHGHQLAITAEHSGTAIFECS